jgi:hypothetical protein
LAVFLSPQVGNPEKTLELADPEPASPQLATPKLAGTDADLTTSVVP